MAESAKKGITLRIPGTQDPAAAGKETEFIRITHSRTYRISAARGATLPPESYTAEWDEVAELEFEDGTRIWTSTRRLCSELLPAGERKRGTDGIFELPAGLPRGEAARGIIGKVLFKTLTFFGVDVAGNTAAMIGGKWEEHTLGKSSEGRGPGLYRCATSGEFALTRCEEGMPKLLEDRPVLLFLHGTASSTRGSFGELWEQDKVELRKKLFAPYQGVLALEHGTLSTTPVQNTLDLVEALRQLLPPNAPLHVVSHSRGGLVGELLCRSGVEGRDPFSADELARFAEQDPKGVRGDLVKLNVLLKERAFRVERFVRVACPAWGTTLASNRLDIYLSILFNLLNKAPCLSALPGVNIAYDIFTELIMLVARQRSDPSVLPGIEAMIPGTPLVQLLNRPDCTVNGELRVIAGDIEGGTLMSALETLAADPLFGTDNDLVVDTEAMFGGADRAGGAAFSFHRGPDVSHFRYFKNIESADRLLKALTRSAGESDGFDSFKVRKSDAEHPPYQAVDTRAPGPQQPVVFLLPDVMGTHLSIGEERIWLDPQALAFGKLGALRLHAAVVEPEEPIRMFYSELAQRLSATHEVIPFPYDWRLSLQIGGEKLAGELEKVLQRAEQAGQPVRIMAHGSGGLLARAVIAYRPATWQRICRHPEARLIMLGTPNGGSYWVQQLLTGRERLTRQLALSDMTHNQTELLEIFRGYPGVLELLPEELFERRAWERLRLEPPELLQEARRTRDAIVRSPLDTARVLYVAGQAPATPCGFAVEQDLDGDPSLVLRATAEGDGRVTWESGIPRDLKTWYLPAAHGDLAGSEEHFGALVDLLLKGTTVHLETVPPVGRGLTPPFTLPEEQAALYSGFQALARAALGSPPNPKRLKTRRRLKVTVAHGNLAFTKHPILLGHYRGDTIVSAEAHLDRIMDGRLRRRHALGLYPGEDDTAEIFLNPNAKPGGAIIIGLGEVGKLSPGKLMQSVSRGVRAYVLALAESCSEVKKPLGIATLLVGTNAGGVSLEASVTAILRGVAEALRSLEEQRLDQQVVIEELEFIEVFEDRAIHAAHALDRARTDPELALNFLIDPALTVKRLDGGLRRAYYSEDNEWWQRLEITENRSGNLVFNLLTDRARSEVYLQQNQRSLTESIREMIDSSDPTGAEVAVTLFEMLVPNEIKENAPDRRNMVLVLNDEAARYPWEMMKERPTQDRGMKGSNPLSVQAGMIRQLQVTEFRQRVVMARGQSALIIGNPPTPYVNLPGAEDEARKVHALLQRRGYDSVARIGADATGSAIMRALHAGDYRIVHLAGHGVYQHEEELPVSCDCCGANRIVNQVTGMVIGDGQFLTPGHLAQMRSVPELVFVNCCHLGWIENAGERPPANYPPGLAANIATELIRMGVKAVVAAGWAVSDLPAQQFAATFYTEMLAGAAFGDAVLRARVAIFNAFPNINTWGAYQCYGDHGFTLSQGTAKGSEARPAERFTAPAEVITKLANIAQEAKTADDQRSDELKEEIAQIEVAIPTEWRGLGEVQVSLGQAYGELREYGKAVGNYQQALEDEKAPCPVKAIEQLCNFLARWAVETAKTDLAGAREKISKSEQQLKALNDLIGVSSARLSLLGGTAKREVMVEAGDDEKRAALRKMAEYYTAANEKKNDAHPYSNKLTATVLLSLLDPGTVPAETLASIQAEVEKAAERRESEDFWKAEAYADYLLLNHLARRDLAQQVKTVIDEFLKVKKSSGSPREFGSVFEHLDFLIDILEMAPAGVRDDVVGPLAQIRAGISAGR